MKNIIILGSTGSIGVQALEVINNHKDKFNLIGISANENVELLVEQAKLYNPKYVCIANKNHKQSLNISLDLKKINLLSGRQGLLELSSISDADIMLNALVGADGMEPTLNAINAHFTESSPTCLNLKSSKKVIPQTISSMTTTKNHQIGKKNGSARKPGVAPGSEGLSK